MKKLTTSHKSFSLLLGLSLLTAVPSWSQDAKLEIARKAITLGTGARGLRTIMERLLGPCMYDLPSQSEVSEVVLTSGYVLGTSELEYRYKTQQAA